MRWPWPPSLPVAAWLINRFSSRTVFLAAVAVFAASSALVAASWNVESLIAFRVVQGLAGGVVTPAAMTLVLGSTPPAERGRAMALLGLPLMLGPILAPVLGGWLLDTVSWRWMFLINLPIGAAAIGLGMRNLPALTATPQGRLDWRGLALLPPALAALVLGTSLMTPGALPPTVVVLFAVGAVLITAFVVHALRAPAPLLDLRLSVTGWSAGGRCPVPVHGATMAGLILMPCTGRSPRAARPDDWPAHGPGRSRGRRGDPILWDPHRQPHPATGHRRRHRALLLAQAGSPSRSPSAQPPG